MKYNSLLNFTFTTPLKLFSPRPPKFTLLPDSGKYLLLFFWFFLLLPAADLISPLNAFSGSHTLFFPDYPPSSLSIFF